MKIKSSFFSEFSLFCAVVLTVYILDESFVNSQTCISWPNIGREQAGLCSQVAFNCRVIYKYNDWVVGGTKRMVALDKMLLFEFDL